MQKQLEDCPDELWLDGAENYQKFVRQLLAEYEDIIGDGEQQHKQVAETVANSGKINVLDLA